jgi:hypothetical protein
MGDPIAIDKDVDAALATVGAADCRLEQGSADRV